MRSKYLNVFLVFFQFLALLHWHPFKLQGLEKQLCSFCCLSQHCYFLILFTLFLKNLCSLKIPVFLPVATLHQSSCSHLLATFSNPLKTLGAGLQFPSYSTLFTTIACLCITMEKSRLTLWAFSSLTASLLVTFTSHQQYTNAPSSFRHLQLPSFSALLASVGQKLNPK